MKRLGISFVLGVLAVILTACSLPEFGERHPGYEVVRSTQNFVSRWSYDAGSRIREMLVDSELDLVYVVTLSSLDAVQLHTGEKIWRLPLNQNHTCGFCPRPMLQLSGELVLVNQNRGSILLGLNRQDGEVRWQTYFGEYVMGRYGEVPELVSLVTDGHRIFVSLRADRRYYVIALDAATGDFLWLSPPELRFDSFLQLEIYQQQLMVLGDPVWILSQVNGEIIDKKELNPNADSEAENVIDFTEKVQFRDIYIYAVRHDYLYGVDLRTVEQTWAYVPTCNWKEMQRPPILHDGSIYQITTCPSIAKVSLTGNVIWEYTADTSIQAFLPIDKIGYLLTRKAEIYAINLEDGSDVGMVAFEPSRFPQIGVSTFQFLAGTSGTLLAHFDTSQLFAFDLQ